ncbi:DUF5667 domain-containing protein [Pseudonocardia sp. MH-G8]|uniref:DUF5667 domain-containing protein n=1 Tax=Pseudonocardia sp. MH-G8 TaxID=1854588 RepID=UPI000BA0EC04|nr:DUF5667 domain-containing protein [Pseudonocardia sp. MH-G8]OZM80381.1 hypothetical protein CFP66_19650 [Pseudonocardia sp. MH-G8]
MPAGQGKDAERFAAAVESGTPLGAAGDDDLARELEIVAMLRSRGAEFSPDAETKARAKQRLMAVLAEQGGPQPGPRPAPQNPPHHGVAPPTSAERTAPLGRLVDPAGPERQHDVDPAARTTRIAPVTARMDVTGSESAAGDTPDAPDDEDAPTAATHQPAPRAGRRARHSTTNRPAGRAGASKRPAAGSLRRRALLVGSAAMAAMIAIASGGIFASQNALPGDNLYAVKRAAESAGLALAFDDASRAQRQLDIAAARLSEVERLSALEPQAAPAPEVFTRVMDEFDVATDEGSQLLLESAGPDATSTAQDDLRTWASEQSERLSEIGPDLPAAAEADESIELLDRLLGRTGSADASGSCDGEECTARRGAETTSPESDEADASKDATSTPDESDETGTRETDEPSRTPSDASTGREPGLLPDLLPDAEREGDADKSSTSKNEDEDSTSTSEPESDDEGSEGDVSVPLPLLPPVTLPPLLPGMPGITIG